MCRLSGHKGVITKLAFMKDHNIVISASKDTFVKFWDLDTEHNFRTLVGHGTEVNIIRDTSVVRFNIFRRLVNISDLINQGLGPYVS